MKIFSFLKKKKDSEKKKELEYIEKQYIKLTIYLKHGKQMEYESEWRKDLNRSAFWYNRFYTWYFCRESDDYFMEFEKAKNGESVVGGHLVKRYEIVTFSKIIYTKKERKVES